EVLFGRDDEPDLVAAHTVPASRSSVSRSSSRRAAASLPACTAWRQSRRALKSAAPKLTPAAKPETFCTGRVMAMLTARTAVSTLSAASTALSVIRSTLSSCPFTRSTLPPTLPITGRRESSAPRMNAVSRATVPARRMMRYADERPSARRNTARASRQRSPQVNAATSILRAILVPARRGDRAAADDGISVVENRCLAGRDAVGRLLELQPEAPRSRLDASRQRSGAVAQLRLHPLDIGVQPPARLDPGARERPAGADDDCRRRRARLEDVQRLRRGEAEAAPLPG